MSEIISGALLEFKELPSKPCLVCGALTQFSIDIVHEGNPERFHICLPCVKKGFMLWVKLLKDAKDE